MEPAVRPFDAFVAGAFSFVAGVCAAIALREPVWSRQDAVALCGAAALLLIAGGRLRALYRAAAAKDPRADAAA